MAKRISPGKARARTKAGTKGGSGSHMIIFEHGAEKALKRGYEGPRSSTTRHTVRKWRSRPH